MRMPWLSSHTGAAEVSVGVPFDEAERWYMPNCGVTTAPSDRHPLPAPSR